MSVLNREQREELFNQQNGMSPFSGLPLDREKQKLEIHHIRERYNGGENNRENLQLLPNYEHLTIHFLRSRDSRLPNEERLRELDIVFGRVCQLDKAEKAKFYNLIKETIGIVVRFI